METTEEWLTHLREGPCNYANLVCGCCSDAKRLLELVDNLQNAVNIYQPQVLELRKLEERVRELEAERGD